VVVRLHVEPMEVDSLWQTNGAGLYGLGGTTRNRGSLEAAC